MRKLYLFALILTLLVNISVAQVDPSRKFYCSGCLVPAPGLSQKSMDSLLMVTYKNWRDTFVVRLPGTDQLYTKVVDNNHPDEVCVSESQGYGMMIVAMIGQRDTSVRTLYDSLYRCFIGHVSPAIMYDHKQSYLMMEGFDPSGKMTNPSSATDGDIDIAYSLLLADANWGDKHPIKYKSEAERTINSIMAYDVNHRSWTLFLDNQEQCDADYTSGKAFATRPSDFIPNALRAFAIFNADWVKVIHAEYALLDSMQNNYHGIVPDFIADINKGARPGRPNEFENRTDGHYSVNACRVPWRITADFLLGNCKNDTARRIIRRFNDFIYDAAQTEPSHVYIDYNLDNGKPRRQDNELYYLMPFTLSAMCDNRRQTWLDSLWDYEVHPKADFIQAHRGQLDYYGETIRLFTLFFLTRNFEPPLISN